MTPGENRSRLFEKIGSREFEAIYKRGRKAAGERLVLFHVTRDSGTAFAVVASRRVGNAVQRNRAKRLLREAFRTQKERLKPNGAYILIARIGILDVKMPEVAGELEKLLTRLDLLLDVAMTRDENDH